MICSNCHDPDCKVEVAESTERITYAWLQAKGSKEAGERWKSASEALEQAQSDCAHRRRINWRARALTAEARADAAEARIKNCAAALAAIEPADTDSFYQYEAVPAAWTEGYRHGCQEMIAILYGEP